MYKITEALERALHMPYPAGAYLLSRVVAAEWGPLALLETEDCDFDLLAFAEEGRCSLFLIDTLAPLLTKFWKSGEGRLVSHPETALFEVAWGGARYRVLNASVGLKGRERWYVGGESEAAVDALFAAVCTWKTAGEGAVQTLQSGYFDRDKRLAAAIQTARLDDLVLEPHVRAELARSCLGFFEARETYEAHGVPWRRGVLLLGPPGNGKTHAIRAVVNAAGRPCLYVRDFDGDDEAAENVRALFERAREVAPCVIVMEDLDSLVPPTALSTLLNELDGFAPNPGVLTIATTNHPERLDPALVERPSRFDRKVTFDPPGRGLRLEFLRRQTEGWGEGSRPDERQLGALADGTEGFTFAYLKELCIGALTTWFYADRERPMAQVLTEELATLRRQIATPAS